jgi:hypothetical protein
MKVAPPSDETGRVRTAAVDWSTAGYNGMETTPPLPPRGLVSLLLNVGKNDMPSMLKFKAIQNQMYTTYSSL